MPKPAKTQLPLSDEPRQGLCVDGADSTALEAALDLALSYRGDVTITRCSDGRAIAGYIFDRKSAGAGKERGSVRLLAADGTGRMVIPEDDIASIEFTGRDNASGKSFDTWMKKYAEKKLAGERAAIDSEPLEE